MTELMLRLLKDGKIVGYELIAGGWHYQAKNLPIRDENMTRERSVDINYNFDWDAFEMGVKVGDDWFFDGDILEENTDGTYVRSYLRYEHSTWVVHYDDAGSYPLDEVIDTTGNWSYPNKVIGNIHEAPDAE